MRAAGLYKLVIASTEGTATGIVYVSPEGVIRGGDGLAYYVGALSESGSRDNDTLDINVVVKRHSDRVEGSMDIQVPVDKPISFSLRRREDNVYQGSLPIPPTGNQRSAAVKVELTLISA